MSLAELLIVVVIMAIMAALAAPRFAAAAQRRRAQSATLRIQCDVALARESARATSSPRTLRFSTADDAYELLGSNALRGGRAGSVQLNEAPYQATLTYADFEGGTDLIVDGYGRIVTSGEIRLQIGATQRRLVFTAHDAPPPAESDGTDSGGLLDGVVGLLGL